MSRRRILHGKAARTLIEYRNSTGGAWTVAVRGNVEQYRGENNIRPRGLRPKPKKDGPLSDRAA